MASVEVDLIVEALAKGFDKLSKELKDVGEAGEKSEKGIEKAGKQTGFLDGQMKKLITGGALLAVGKALLDFGKASLTAASDAQEMQSKFDTVFGALGGQVTDQLGQFADASNRSKIELMGFAATIQDTLKPMGIAADEAAGLSVDLVKLGTDLASFNNMPMDEAMRRLQGTLIGSHENALAFGVVINENTLKAELAANGWDKLTGSQLEAAKVQARINLLMKGTTDAQGDAIKTADSYANTSKGTEAALLDLKVAIGEGLIPALTDAKQATTEYVSELTKLILIKNILAIAVDKGVITQSQFVDMQLRAALTGETLAEQSEEVIAVMEELSTKTEGATKNVEKLSVASERLNSHLARQAEEQAEVTAAIEETKQALLDEAAALERDVNRALLEFSGNLGPTTRELEEMAYASGELGDYQEAMLGPIRENAEAIEALKQATAAYFIEAINAKDGIGLFNETAEEMADRSIFVSDMTRDQRSALSDLQSEYEKAQGIITDYTIGAKGVGLTTEEVNEKVSEQQERMAELQGAMEPLLALGGEYAEVQGTMTINEDALNQSIFDSAKAAGASAEQMAILGGALGLYSDEAVEAALKSAAIQIKIDELAQAYVDGKISVDDMRGGIQDFIASLDEIPAAVTTDVQVTGVDAAMAKVGSLQQQLNNLGNQVSAAEAAGATQRDDGSVGLAHGADFVVPPGFPNDSFGPLFVQSGEHVKVTPAGQSGGGAGGAGVTNVFHVSQRPGENGHTFAKRVARMAADEMGGLK